MLPPQLTALYQLYCNFIVTKVTTTIVNHQ